MKKKYKVMKKGDEYYNDLSTDYERKQMPDYSFKSNSQTMGANEKKIHRNKIIKNILIVIGAILVIYIGYFIVEVQKQVNNRPDSAITTAITTTAVSTTFPSSEESVSESTSDTSISQTEKTTNSTTSGAYN